jgi:hypothetical protein
VECLQLGARREGNGCGQWRGQELGRALSCASLRRSFVLREDLYQCCPVIQFLDKPQDINIAFYFLKEDMYFKNSTD